MLSPWLRRTYYSLQQECKHKTCGSEAAPRSPCDNWARLEPWSVALSCWASKQYVGKVALLKGQLWKSPFIFWATLLVPLLLICCEGELEGCLRRQEMVQKKRQVRKELKSCWGAGRPTYQHCCCCWRITLKSSTQVADLWMRPQCSWKALYNLTLPRKAALPSGSFLTASS